VLLDQPFEQADGEGDARRLDRLQVDRRQQVRDHLVQRSDALAGRAGDGDRIGGVAEVGHRRNGPCDVEHALGAYRHDAGPVSPLHPADKRTGHTVFRKDFCHWTSPFLT
jgi:hypothetical protein